MSISEKPTLKILGASPVAGQRIGCEIHVREWRDDEMSKASMDEIDAFQTKQGEALEAILAEHLAGATYDALLAAMLSNVRSRLIISFGGKEKRNRL